MVDEWMVTAGLDPVGFETLLPGPEFAPTGRIAISIWIGRDRRALPDTRQTDAESREVTAT
jgi:hypothetical protein